MLSADGADIHVYDQGRGPAILIVGPGLDDGTRTRMLASILARRFRVLRLHRRQYRPDLKTEGTPCSVAQEVDDVLAIARQVGRPLIIYGHSSGGVVALEALAAAPSAFTGAVLFEPASVIDTAWAGQDGEVVTHARAAIAAGRPGQAMAIFFRRTIGLPGRQAWAAGALTAIVPRYRRLASCQIDDLEAMDRLGVRLDAYSQITTPTLLLSGDRSTPQQTAPVDAIERVLSDPERRPERVVMRKRDHGADLKAPKTVARIIETFADTLL
ncbi:alpha/beta hydrolase [Nonomuraea sp. NPDC049695]|uniref:alpha/beta fold hydrolase n=1 Tax=Nonomuraea sp. NPDC049695 TaxID=3154734 RepID=UPI0034217EEF